MKQHAFEQLLDCRRLRQDRAGEVLAARRLAQRQADQHAARARTAVFEHETERRQRENVLLQEMQGRRMSLAEIERYKGRLAEFAAESDRLRGQVAAAEAETRRRDSAVAEALAVFADQRREHEKWRELTTTTLQQAARRQDALSEIEAESQQSDRDGARRASGRVF